MLIREISDGHLEFLGDYHSHPSNNGRDWNTEMIVPSKDKDKETVLILAGDIIMIKFKERYTQFFKELNERFRKVLVIMGNHEHYRNNFKTGYRDYKLFLEPFENIHLLEKETIVIDNVAFFGATLWTDFNKRDPFAMGYAINAMSDYQVINYVAEDGTGGNIGKWTPELSVLEHEETLYHMIEFFRKYKEVTLKKFRWG